MYMYTAAIHIVVHYNIHYKIICMQDGSTALMFAAQNGHRDVIKILLRSTSCDHHIKDKVSSLAWG